MVMIAVSRDSKISASHDYEYEINKKL